MSDIDPLFACPIILASILVDGSMSIVQVHQLRLKAIRDVCINAWNSKFAANKVCSSIVVES